MRLLALLPILTAALAIWCALVPAARRFIWPVVALAAVNAVLTPLSSGEWFYQQQEYAFYDSAVSRGDFTGFDRLLAQHDPQLQPRMTGLAVGLLVALVVLAVLRVRADRGAGASAVAGAVAAGAVLLAAAANLAQGVLLLV